MLLTLVLATSLFLLGLTVGALVAKAFQSSAMGFDQIASTLGGVMVGGAGGVVLAVVLGRYLGLPMLRRVAAVTGLLAVALLWVGAVKMQRAKTRAAADAAPPPGLRPTTELPVPTDN